MFDRDTGFDWDRGNWHKCQKHGVTVADIEEMFRGAPVVAPDIRHSNVEIRFLAMGRNAGGRLIFVVFTMRQVGQETLIRPVSARFMREKELRRHAKRST